MDFEDSFDYYTSEDWDDDYYNSYRDDDDWCDDYPEHMPDPTWREIWASSDLTLREKIAMIASGWFYTLKHRISWWWRWEFREGLRRWWHQVRTGKPYEDDIPF